MAGSFLDTTIVIELVDGNEPSKTCAESHIANNPPVETPYYTLKELLSGHLQYICQTHNILLASENAAEAILALINRSPVEGRKREARLRILANEVSKVFESDPTGQRQTVKREVLEALALRAAKIWRKAHHIRSVGLTQPLSCLNDGDISHGSSGELQGPRNSFNCVKTERCAAAAYLYDKKVDIQKMIDALHPAALGDQAGKNENQKRRKALKELLTKGAISFDKGRCRALGDAYIAAMSPPGFNVVTTNVMDFQPLCAALTKTVITPKTK